MDVKKINRLKGRLDDLRRKGGIKSSEVEALAKALGRVHDKKRGKEPTWVNRDFPGLRPLTIPHHSTDLNEEPRRKQRGIGIASADRRRSR